MAKRTSLEILVDFWNRQKSRPEEVGPLEVVSDKLFYLGIALRQRPAQQRARVGIAADRIFYGENKRRAQTACDRFALEIRRLGGTGDIVEDRQVDATGSVWHTWHVDVRFEDMGYKSVNRQQRIVAREAKEAEERLKAQETQPPKRIRKTSRKGIGPVGSILGAPRLVKKIPQAS